MIWKKKDFYRYLQIRDYFERESKKMGSTEPNLLVEVIIDSYTKNNPRIISSLYRAMMENRKNTSSYIKQKWERELGEEIPDEEWYFACKTQHTITYSQRWKEFAWKNLVRYFITPRIKSKQLSTPQI